MGRVLRIEIFRYNPCDPDSKPRIDTFCVEEKSSMNIFLVLNEIREKMDPSLKFDFVCRSGICGSCGMLINGKPALACRTKTADLPDRITLYPLPGFKIIGDLSVDTGSWFREADLILRSWIHTTKKFNPDEAEFRMKNSIASEIFELDRCIECGCCVSACSIQRINNKFLSAPSINRIARFMVDPRDERTEKEFFEVIGTREGVFGCVGLMACEDVCPRGLKLQKTISMVRRKLTAAAIEKNPLLRWMRRFLIG